MSSLMRWLRQHFGYDSEKIQHVAQPPADYGEDEKKRETLEALNREKLQQILDFERQLQYGKNSRR